MTDMQIRLHWSKSSAGRRGGKGHMINFDDFTYVPGDAAADWGGDADKVNPEQLLAASVSSCHMMTFLALAEKAGWSVLGYTDVADAALGEGKSGRMTVTDVKLSPVVELDSTPYVSHQQIEEMHERAHRYCFVANALSAHITITPQKLNDTEQFHAT